MLVVDVEASGTEAAKHSIVSIGALDFSNPSIRFYGECRIWEGAHVMPEALMVNGFSEEQIKESVRLLFTLANLKVEPTGALGVAALLAAPKLFYGHTVCCIASGGNVDPELFRNILVG